MKNHFLPNPPSPTRHEKSLFTLPPLLITLLTNLLLTNPLSYLLDDQLNSDLLGSPLSYKNSFCPTPPPPLVMQNHFLPKPPSSPRHEKSLLGQPPPPLPHDIICEQPLILSHSSNFQPFPAIFSYFYQFI